MKIQKDIQKDVQEEHPKSTEEPSLSTNEEDLWTILSPDDAILLQ
jgi:hypothetical protein